jgi:hypothetical protein
VADPVVIPQVAVAAAIGIIAGVGLLLRGFQGYRTAIRIGDTASSRIGSMAVGEVRVSGTAEAAELLLVSPLQSASCVYYRASVEDTDGETGAVFREERAIGFRVVDDTGAVRVFPRGARFDIPARWVESTSSLAGTPAGLRPRTGSGVVAGQPTHEEQVAALLTVRRARPSAEWSSGATNAGRRYAEARIEPGDRITVVGRAMPFDQLPDPADADAHDGPSDPRSALLDAEIAADLAAARAAGTLAPTPEEAWGNAAIPGFGIGRPAREPELHPDAHEPPLGTAADAERAARTFAIDPGALILAAAPDVPLLIAAGTPTVAADRQEWRFLVGLLGALLAIGSAMALGVMLSGGFGS